MLVTCVSAAQAATEIWPGWRWPTRAVAASACVVVFGLAVGAGPVVAQNDDEAPGAQTWSVQPANEDGADGRAAFEYELEPGESVDDFAQVNNFGEQELTFDVYSHDALNTPDGAFTLQPADVEPEQVGVWIGLDEQVTIEPGDSMVVPFTLAVPKDATPGDHAGGIVASITSEGTDDEGNQVLVDNRVGSRIYLRVAGEVDPILEVTQLDAGYSRSWVPFTTGEMTATYVVRNVGNVRLSGDQEITVAGLFGLGERAVTLAGLPEVLPGEAVTATAEVDSVAPFVRLSGDVAVNPIPPETAQDPIPPVLATAAASVWAIPWPELIILALVVLGVWWAWWRRRRRKRTTKAMVEEAVAKAREEMRQELQNKDSAIAAETEPASAADYEAAGESAEKAGTSATPNAEATTDSDTQPQTSAGVESDGDAEADAVDVDAGVTSEEATSAASAGRDGRDQA